MSLYKRYLLSISSEGPQGPQAQCVLTWAHHFPPKPLPVLSVPPTAEIPESSPTPSSSLLHVCELSCISRILSKTLCLYYSASAQDILMGFLTLLLHLLYPCFLTYHPTRGHWGNCQKHFSYGFSLLRDLWPPHHLGCCLQSNPPSVVPQCLSVTDLHAHSASGLLSMLIHPSSRIGEASWWNRCCTPAAPSTSMRAPHLPHPWPAVPPRLPCSVQILPIFKDQPSAASSLSLLFLQAQMTPPSIALHASHFIAVSLSQCVVTPPLTSPSPTCTFPACWVPSSSSPFPLMPYV